MLLPVAYFAYFLLLAISHVLGGLQRILKFAALGIVLRNQLQAFSFSEYLICIITFYFYVWLDATVRAGAGF
jgi:hypothetical protein